MVSNKYNVIDYPLHLEVQNCNELSHWIEKLS